MKMWVSIGEKRAKGWVVHRCVMQRLGALGAGWEVLTKGRLLEFLEDPAASRAVVFSLATVSRGGRSMPLQFFHEGKNLDSVMKRLSWRPPWAGGDGKPDKKCAMNFIASTRRIAVNVQQMPLVHT